MNSDTSNPIIIDDSDVGLGKFIDHLRQHGSLTIQVGEETFRVTATPLQVSRAARRLLTGGGPSQSS